jgi:hypothetical protein
MMSERLLGKMTATNFARNTSLCLQPQMSVRAPPEGLAFSFAGDEDEIGRVLGLVRAKSE